MGLAQFSPPNASSNEISNETVFLCSLNASLRVRRKLLLRMPVNQSAARASLSALEGVSRNEDVDEDEDLTYAYAYVDVSYAYAAALIVVEINPPTYNPPTYLLNN